ncbi:MAG: hypothetical protein AAF650_05790 [Pseudomonadota bacterium]
MSAPRWYHALLRLYPRSFRDRFGSAMVQTFADLDRDRAQAGRSRLLFHSWIFLETSGSIMKENAAMLNATSLQMRNAALAACGLLLLPLALTLANPDARLLGGKGGGFDWMPGSFLVMGVMLFTAALAVQIVSQRASGAASRTLAIGAIALVFVALWAELAVDGVSKVFSFLV